MHARGREYVTTIVCIARLPLSNLYTVGRGVYAGHPDSLSETPTQEKGLLRGPELISEFLA